MGLDGPPPPLAKICLYSRFLLGATLSQVMTRIQFTLKDISGFKWRIRIFFFFFIVYSVYVCIAQFN
jgi:hypothetical protein